MAPKPLHALLLALSTIVWAAAPAGAQEHSSTAETQAQVPALTEFHPVIYSLWHDAWPKKDFDALKALLPAIEQGASAISAAELPGILRERQAAWSEGVSRFRTIVDAYKKDVETNNQQQLLDDAEKLHAGYESLVRSIRPPLKELEQFHAVLYMLYHYYMPGDSLAIISSSLGQLQQRMSALEKAVLPARLKDRQEAFLLARSTLGNSLTTVSASLATKDMGKIRSAIEEMHSAYESLARTLE